MKKNLVTLCSLLLVKIVDSCQLTVVSLRTPNKLSTVNYKLSTIFAFCLLPFIISAQTITVEVLIAPPVASHVTDYINQNVLKITNSSTVPMSIYLKGTLTSDNGISGKTKDGYRPKRPIVVPPNNQPLILQATQQNGVDFTDNKNLDYVSGNYSIANIVRTGVVPEGNYTLCISAYDYITNELKSRNDAAFNCRTFNIILPQPPTIDCDINVPTLNGTQRLLVGDKNDAFNPIAQNPTFIRFNWLPTNANGKAIIVAYDLYLLKLQDGQNGQDALTAAIRNKQNNPIKFSDIRTTQYDAILAISPSLVAGRYAWAVVAKDGGGGQTVFENNGVSTICEFEWKTPVMANVAKAPAPIVAADIKPSCDECKLSIPQGNVSTYDLKIGDNVNIGNHTFRINSVGADHAKGWSGTARIAIKIAGISAIPFLVDFSNLTFVKTGDKLNAKTGTAKVQTHPGAPSFVPKFSKPDMPSLMDVKPEEALAFDDYLSKNVDQTLKGYKENFNNSGLQVPFGIGGDNGAPTLSIVNITFTPEFSWFDALAGMQIGDNPGMIAFGASGVCLRADDGDGLCGNAVLYLANDLVIDALNFKLLGANGHDLKDACYLKITDSKVQEGQFVGQFDFPDNKLVRADGKPERVIAEARFKATSWSDWMAEVTIPDFKIKGAEDFTFHTSKATYDHSDLINPKGMPDDYNDAKNNTAWHGFFLPDLNVDIPGVFNTVDNKQIKVGVKNLIIDNTGNVTVKIYADNVISLGDGSLDGWGYSLDHLEANFYKSDFQNGSFKGKFLLPITDKKVQYALDYTGLFTYHNDLKKDKLKYTFTVAPDANRELDVQMWAAKLKIGGNSNIKVSNENDENKFHAEAHLYGEMSVNTKDITIPGVKISLPDFNLADLKFQDLFLKSFKDPKKPDDKYFGIDKTEFTTGFASPPKSAGGFPLSITSFDYAPDIMGANASFKIGLALAFSDKDKDNGLSATGLFYIKGNLDVPVIGGGTWTPKLVGLECSGIDIKGKIGPVKIDGKVQFFSNDATWGNGVYGGVKASAMDGKIDLGSVSVQFSNKNELFSWFVDAKTNVGFNLIPAFQVYGFGVGISYHMDIANLPTSQSLKNVSNLPQTISAVGQTLSGIKYTPNVNTGLNFKAELNFGVGSSDVFNADTKIDIAFNAQTNGVEHFHFNGNGRYLQSEGSEPLASGTLDVDYDQKGNVFDAVIGVAIHPGAPLSLESAKIFLYFSDNGWNIKLGRPLSINNGNDAVVFSIFAGLKARAYFQVGSYNVDATPELPDFVKDQLSEVGINPESVRSNRTFYNDKNILVAFGAGIDFKTEGTFVIFYGKMQGALGFDLSLSKLGKCNGKDVGVNGWYATGQFYAALYAELGIDIDLGFFDAKISVLSANAAAVVSGGGPNPFYGHAAIGVKVKAFGIDGRISCQFEVGETDKNKQCSTGDNSDALAKIKVISDVQPDGDKVKTMDIDEYPRMAFNYKLGNTFSVDEFDKDFKKTTRYFRLLHSNVTISLKVDGVEKAFKPYFPQDDANSMYIIPNEVLMPEKNGVLTIKATMFEVKNGQDVIAKRNDGTDFEEVRTINFTTNKGLDSIKPSKIVNIKPVPAQRFFTTDDNALGYLKFNQNYTLDVFNAPKGAVAFVRFVKLNGQIDKNPANESAVNIVNGGKEWQFNLPSLDPQQVYVAQFILRWSNTSNSQSNILTQLETKNFSNKFGGFAFSEQKLNDNKLRASKNEKIVFGIPFRTSLYKSYSEKLKAFKFREMIFTKGYANPQSKIKIWVLNEQTQVISSIADRVKVQLNLPNMSGLVIDPSEFNFWTNETFDEIEINGTTLNYFGGPPTQIEQIVTFDNEVFKNWEFDLRNNIQGALVQGGFKTTQNFTALDKNTSYGLDALTDIATIYAPKLTANECLGLPWVGEAEMRGFDNPNDANSYVYMNYQELHPEQPMLTIKYHIGFTSNLAITVNDIIGRDKLLWGVNPASNGFNAMGNAFDVGMNGMNNVPNGVNLNASIGGKNLNFNVIAH